MARQARSCCGVSCCISCLQPTSISDTRHKCPLRLSLSLLYITNSSSRLSQAHKPEHHGLRRHDYVDPDVEPEKLKTVNSALVTLRFSCVYGSAKRHTICVATHVVFLVVFERDHDLPSNTRQQPSYLGADSNATVLLKSKDRDLPCQMAKTRLGRPALSTGQTKLTMCFGGMLELMLEMWPICARNTNRIRDVW